MSYHSSLALRNNHALVLSNLLIHLYFIVVCSLLFLLLKFSLSRSFRESYHNSLPNITINYVVTLIILQPTLAF